MPKVYKVNQLFCHKYNFLRVRKSCKTSSVDNVVYKVKDSDFGGVEWNVDEGASTKDWYRIESVSTVKGSRVGGPGWVTKKYDDVFTLIPKTVKNVRPNTPASSNSHLNKTMASRVRSMVGRAAGEGRGGLGSDWMADQIQNPNLRRAVFEHGAAAWKYLFYGEEFGMHVRIVKRHGIVADAGYGQGVAHAVHAAAACTMLGAAAGLIGSTRFSADVILTFLDSIPGAERAHRNAGYKNLETGGGLQVMYHQEGRRQLSQEQVHHLFSKYCR